MKFSGVKISGIRAKTQNNLVTTGLIMWLDAGNPASYPGKIRALTAAEVLQNYQATSWR